MKKYVYKQEEWIFSQMYLITRKTNGIQSVNNTKDVKLAAFFFIHI